MSRRALMVPLAIVLGITLAGVGTLALASRNTAGTYTLPAGNPVVTGTPINSTVMNNTTGDIAAALTDSLSRSGYGGMQSPIRTPDGTVTAPAHSFNNDTGAGLYRIGANDYGFAVNGVKQCEWTSTAVTLSNDLILSSGNVNLSSAAQQTFYKTGSGNFIIGTGANTAFEFAQNGIARWYIDTNGSLNALDTAHLISNLSTPVSSGDAATKGYVDARFVVAGHVRGTDGAILSQTGSVTASCSRSSTGVYVVTISGLTSSAVVLLNGMSSSSTTVTPVLGSGSFTAFSNPVVDSDFSFQVVKL